MIDHIMKANQAVRAGSMVLHGAMKAGEIKQEVKSGIHKVKNEAKQVEKKVVRTLNSKG